MAPVRPPLAPLALRAYNDAQGIASTLNQPREQAFAAEAKTPAPPVTPGPDAKPPVVAKTASALKPPAAPTSFSLKTLSTFAGVLVGEQDAVAAIPTPIKAPADEAPRPSARPRPPGSMLDLKV